MVIYIIMHYLIYKTTNLLNGMFYIGKHKTKNKNDGYFGSGTYLLKAVELYGRHNFKTEILFECKDQNEMEEKERELVDHSLLSRLDTYNIVKGSLTRNGNKPKSEDISPIEYGRYLYVQMIKEERFRKEFQNVY